MNHHTPRDPAAHLILRTLVAPFAIAVALLCLLPAFASAAEPVYSDAPDEGVVRKVEVRSGDSADGVRLQFRVKTAANARVERLRVEFATSAGWDTVELERTGGAFVGSVVVEDDADVSFFVLGADADGRITNVRYGTLGEPASIASR